MALASERGRHRARRRVGRPPGPQPDAGRRREELLEAATRAIRRLGPDVSMDELAAEAGMTKPILYTHFGDKSGLAAALAERWVADLAPVILDAFMDEKVPRATVRAGIDAFIAFVEREPDLYRFLVRGFAGAERSFVEQHLVNGFGLQLAQVLRTGLRALGTDTGPAEVWAFAILGAVFAGAEWWLVRPTMTRDDLVDYLTALVWGGLVQGSAARPGSGPGESYQE